MTYPKGTRFNDWTICTDQQNGNLVYTVRRWVIYPDGKKVFERHPVKKYKDVRDDQEQLKNFVIRLNNRLPEEQRTRAIIEIRHAFIDQKLIDSYMVFLNTEIPGQPEAQKHFSYVHRHFLQFFINKLGLADPLAWHKNQTAWGQALLNEFPKDMSEREINKVRIWEKDHLPAGSTIKEVVNNSNRFMTWLHSQKPDYVPPLKFSPVSKAARKKLDARRKMLGKTRVKRFITDEDWKKIKAKLVGKDIEAHVLLAYNFGLRLAETLPFIQSDVRKGYLAAERQLKIVPPKELPLEESFSTTDYADVLKGRANRKIPYWFADAKQVYKWVKMAKENIMHPDTLGDKWKTFVKEIDMEYEFHDLRRTWTTRAFRIGKFEGTEVRPTDIQLAAGHVSINTTMQYKLDDRDLDDDIFIPD